MTGRRRRSSTKDATTAPQARRGWSCSRAAGMISWQLQLLLVLPMWQNAPRVDAWAPSQATVEITRRPPPTTARPLGSGIGSVAAGGADPSEGQQAAHAHRRSRASQTWRSDGRPRRQPRAVARQRDNKSDDGGGTSSWRVYGVEVHPDALVADRAPPSRSGPPAIPPADELHPAVLQSLYSRLFATAPVGSSGSIPDARGEEMPPSLPTPIESIRVVRRSLDARHKKVRADGGTGPRFVYVLDVRLVSASVAKVSENGDWQLRRLRHQPGRLERYESDPWSATPNPFRSVSDHPLELSMPSRPIVVVVGAGPAGLLAALTLARTGHVRPVVLERGRPVEARGRDIGALVHRRSLDRDSNYAFGEGGAGTWSDGKLTTRIGRNSGPVRAVLEDLVRYGAPESILVEGAPHLGTDNLVRLLRNLRHDLTRLGGEILFEHKVTKLLVEGGAAVGVAYERSVQDLERPSVHARVSPPVHGKIRADAVILATGHSARDVYEHLHDAGVKLEPKGFAVGYRVEHPQALINRIQYGAEWSHSVVTGKANTDFANRRFLGGEDTPAPPHAGRLPVPSYRLALDQASDGQRNRGVYSFCMCPGGQIVPASTEPDEVCVNGMSFSRRDSQWANSALVVTVSPDDEVLEPYRAGHGVLAGVAFQRDMEKRASRMGGGNLTVPVQRLTDFVASRPSTSAPPSSYRLGVRPAACHEIYPPPLVASLRLALRDFDRRMPGFLCEDGLLHAVETRTSSPVRVTRDAETMQAIGARNLFPAGEGAGFAGGIVSAAVDGMMVAECVLDTLLPSSGRASHWDRVASTGVDNFY